MAPVSSPNSAPGFCHTTCAPAKKPVRESNSSVSSPERFAMLTPAIGPNWNAWAETLPGAVRAAANAATKNALRMVLSF